MSIPSLLAVDPDDDALGDLCGGVGRPAGGRGLENLAGRDLPQVEVVGRSAVLVHVRASVPAVVVGNSNRLESNFEQFLIYVQGDHSGSSQPPVDNITKDVF